MGVVDGRVLAALERSRRFADASMNLLFVAAEVTRRIFLPV
jgi:hypothetical protein